MRLAIFVAAGVLLSGCLTSPAYPEPVRPSGPHLSWDSTASRPWVVLTASGWPGPTKYTTIFQSGEVDVHEQPYFPSDAPILRARSRIFGPEWERISNVLDATTSDVEPLPKPVWHCYDCGGLRLGVFFPRPAGAELALKGSDMVEGNYEEDDTWGTLLRQTQLVGEWAWPWAETRG